jgi:hyperosmotically inducible protein
MKLRIKTALLTVSFIFPAFAFTGCRTDSLSANRSEPGPSIGSINSMITAETTNSLVDTNGFAAADNSQQNASDATNGVPTAAGQGNSTEDIWTTRQIRRMVVNGTNSFSMMARNLKIITLNGKVTLRGPVNTEAEKKSIETIAKAVAGDENVDDEIKVKTNP